MRPISSETRLADHVRHFEGLFAADPDPWRTRLSRAEAHKRRTVLAALGTRRLGRGLELGCANGVTTRSLAPRFARLLALDAAAPAVALARAAVADLPHVEVHQALLPCPLPLRAFDAAVASEVLYYLPRPDLLATLRLLRGTLRPGGRLISVNHLERFEDAEVSAAELTALTRRVFGRERRSLDGAGWRCLLFRA